jgi:hypothetical protein
MGTVSLPHVRFVNNNNNNNNNKTIPTTGRGDL